MRPKLAILISGRGSNMAAILRRASDEDWVADFCLVLSNEPKATGLETAEEFGIPTAVLNHRDYRGRRPDYDTDLAKILEESDASWVILAGFMRILGPAFTRPFAGRILNIHPSLLPLYPGLDTHQRALDAGDSVAGCTVHLVDETLDGGQTLAQAEVPILPGDDADALAARVLAAEHNLYPQVVRDLIGGRIVIGTDPQRSAAKFEAEAPK
jgi:phosphoribosylglycinamide formyltransferase-1